jgi:alpha-glucosidase
LFLIDPDPALFSVQDQFAYGADMIVAPIIAEAAMERSVVLPEGRWRHLFTGEVLGPGTHGVAAPLGRPPVFTREGSPFSPLFSALAERTA